MAGSPPANLPAGIWTDGECILTPRMTDSETASDRPPATPPSKGSKPTGSAIESRHTPPGSQCAVRGRGISKSRAKGAAAAWVLKYHKPGEFSGNDAPHITWDPRRPVNPPPWL